MAKIPTLASLNFVTGQLGSGKSVYATRLMFHYLATGKVACCNPEPLTMSFGFIAGMISMAVGFGVFVVPATFYHALRMQ